MGSQVTSTQPILITMNHDGSKRRFEALFNLFETTSNLLLTLPKAVLLL